MAETRTGGGRTGARTKAASPKEGTKAEAGAEAEAQTQAPQAPHVPHVCNVAFCPVGMALSAVQGAAPDVLDHLLAAAREFLLAAKAVVDARSADFPESKKETVLQKIEIG